MTNTIPNVPRELLERASNLAFQTQHYPLHEELRTLLSAPSPANHVEDVRAMVAAPSPAGVDGLAVSSSGWFSLVMNAAAELETASYSITDPDAKRVAQSGADYYRSKAKSAQVVCLSDAQAIIDGLRGEVDKLMTTFVRVADHLHIDCEKAKSAPGKPSDVFIAAIDQQARRIGELEGLLRHAQKQVPTGSGLHMRIDAALSAVCAAAPNIATTSEHSGS